MSSKELQATAAAAIAAANQQLTSVRSPRVVSDDEDDEDLDVSNFDMSDFANLVGDPSLAEDSDPDESSPIGTTVKVQNQSENEVKSENSRKSSVAKNTSEGGDFAISHASKEEDDLERRLQLLNDGMGDSSDQVPTPTDGPSDEMAELESRLHALSDGGTSDSATNGVDLSMLDDDNDSSAASTPTARSTSSHSTTTSAPMTPKTARKQNALDDLLVQIQERQRQYEAAMVKFKVANDNAVASQLACDLRVLQEAEKMHHTEGGMSVIHMEIPPDLSVRLEEIAGREGRLKAEAQRRQLEEKRRTEQKRREACFDEVEAYFSQLLISSANNKQTLQKLGRQLKLIKQVRADPTRPPPVYHWEKIANRVPVSNDDVEVRPLFQFGALRPTVTPAMTISYSRCV